MVIRELNARGSTPPWITWGAHLTAEDTSNATGDILTLDEIDKAGWANVSIKLTQIGMGLDESICCQNLHPERARELVPSVSTSRTPLAPTSPSRIYQAMLERGFTTRTMGMAAQSYLYRAEADVRAPRNGHPLPPGQGRLWAAC